MNVYRSTHDEGLAPFYAGTRGDAHTHAKRAIDKRSALVELCEFEPTKAALVDLLNGVPPRMTMVRCWGLTARGGLREMPQCPEE